jgi:hypothetical protein
VAGDMRDVVHFPEREGSARDSSSPPPGTVSVASTVEPPDSSLKMVDDYVAAELGAALTKKSSIETRSLAIVAVNTGLATLYVAAQIQFGQSPSALSLWARGLLIGGLSSAVASIGLAVIAVLPTRYHQPTKQSLTRLFQRSSDPNYSYTRMEIVESRILEYSDLTAQNRRKATLAAISFALLGAFALVLVAVLILGDVPSKQ